MFDEGQAPADIGSTSPDPSTWGKPTGWYSSSTCNIAEKFRDLKIIISKFRDILLSDDFKLTRF
jgi:hypothetical protein